VVEGGTRKMSNVEICKFIEKNIVYDIELYKYSINEISIDIHNKDSETGLTYNLIERLSNQWKVEEILPYSSKDDGICNTMRH